MKFLGAQPAGNSRTGMRFKELQAKAREQRVGRSTGVQYRQASGGTVIVASDAENQSRPASTLTWLA